MPNLLIIGAGINQLPAIQLAKSRGYRVVVTDMSETAPGLTLADETGIVSTRDIDGSIAFARKSHSVIPIDGVMTMASESAVTVATIATELGLAGSSPEAAENATNKLKRLMIFHSHNVPTSQFQVAHDLKEAQEKGNLLGWPLVIKPVDSAGSRGVQKVVDEQELKDAIERVRNVSNSTEFVLEEFLEGSEHSIEGVVVDGQVYWAGISDRNYDKKEIYPPYFLEDGDTMPSSLPPNLIETITSHSTVAVKALGISWGPVKGDIIIDKKKGVKVLEMAARLSGDHFCNETIPLHNGINLLEIVMDLSLGNPIDNKRLLPVCNNGVALRYIWPKPGEVISVTGIQEAENMEGVEWIRFEPKYQNLSPGDIISEPTYMAERVASVMAVGLNRKDAIAVAEKAVRLIDISTRDIM